MSRRARTRISVRQWGLPAGCHGGTPDFATLREVVDPKVRTRPFEKLPRRLQREIVAERIGRQRTFRMWMLGRGVITRKAAQEAVRQGTPVGLALLRIERQMIALVTAEAERRRRRRH